MSTDKSSLPNEYLEDDPLLLWLQDIIAELDGIMTTKHDRVAAVSLHIVRDDVQNILTSYNKLATTLTQEYAESTTVVLNEIAEAHAVVMKLLRLDLRNLMQQITVKPPAWVAASQERYRQMQMTGSNTSPNACQCMHYWDVAIKTQERGLNDILRDAFGPEMPSTDSGSSLHYQHQEKLLAEDFGRDFLGSGAEILRHNVEDMMKQGKRMKDGKRYNTTVYANVIPILQSSGSGKTRTVAQLAEKNLGLLVCVRPDHVDQTPSYPPRDAKVAKWLVQSGDIFENTRSIAVWLIAMAEELTRFYETELRKHKSQYGAEHDRSSFILRVGQVLSPAYTRLSRLSDERDVNEEHIRVILLDSIDVKASMLMNQERFSHQRFSASNPKPQGSKNPVSRNNIEAYHCGQYFAKPIKDAFQKLAGCVRTEGDESFFHLAIDECSDMGGGLHILRRLWSFITADNCFAFLLDTTTQISLTYGHEAISSSFRTWIGNALLLPPFINLPLNLALHEVKHYQDVLKGKHKASHDELEGWLRKMGRPLLNDNRLVKETRQGKQYFDTEKLIEKMIGRTGPVELYKSTGDRTSLSRTIALLSNRVKLTLVGLSGNPLKLNKKDVSPTLGGLAEELVATYMGRLKTVGPGGELISIVAPSEPWLSLAAAHVFRDDPKQHWSSAFDAIKKVRADYSVESGDVGEEIASIILHIAADFSVDVDSKNPLQPINLQCFLDALYGDGAKVPEYHDLRAWAKGYWLNFTHFLQNSQRFEAEKNRLSTPQLAEAWTRRAAMRGAKYQIGWDLLLVIYRSDERPTGTDMFDPRRLSLLPIQVKNHEMGDSSGWNADFAATTTESEDIELHPIRCTIWFDLRATSSTSSPTSTLAPVEIQRWSPTSKRTQRKSPRQTRLHSLFRGLEGINAIKCLEKQARKDISLLLGRIPVPEIKPYVPGKSGPYIAEGLGLFEYQHQSS